MTGPSPRSTSPAQSPMYPTVKPSDNFEAGPPLGAPASKASKCAPQPLELAFLTEHCVFLLAANASWAAKMFEIMCDLCGLHCSSPAINRVFLSMHEFNAFARTLAGRPPVGGCAAEHMAQYSHNTSNRCLFSHSLHSET